jgi:hypothetical protein
MQNPTGLLSPTSWRRGSRSGCLRSVWECVKLQVGGEQAREGVAQFCRITARIGYHVTGFQPSLRHGFAMGAMSNIYAKLFSTRETKQVN